MQYPNRDFRKNNYWHVRNFNAQGKLSRSAFQRAMKHVPATFLDPDTGGHLKSEFTYKLADKLCSGREGHCFGMSVAAVLEWQKKKAGQSLSANQKSKGDSVSTVSRIRMMTPELKEHILQLHLRQLEGSYLKYVANLLMKGEVFASPKSVQAIVSLIDREGCALVNAVNVRSLAGHTMVAYDYERDVRSGSYILYVADSNHPWKAADQEVDQKNIRRIHHPSYLRLVPSGNGRYKADLYYKKVRDERYDCLFGVPHEYLK